VDASSLDGFGMLRPYTRTVRHIDDAGHAANLTHPEATNAALGEFLASV
jgi:pimeloyl-ACP methyl ester carboxylesterase